MATRLERGVPPRRAQAAVAWALLPLLVAISAVIPDDAVAQVWRREARVDASVTATTNGSGRPVGLEESEVLLGVTPGLRVRREAADYSLNLSGSLELLGSLNGTREAEVLPRLEAVLNSTLVDRWLYLDASASVRQVEVDPFLGRSSPGAGNNVRRAEYVQVRPYIRHEFSPRVEFEAALEETYTSVQNDEAANARVHAGRVALRGRPRPLGFGLEYQRQDTRYVEIPEGSWELETARASVQALLFDELVISLIAGREQTSSSLAERNDDILGLGLRWAPGPRTEFEGQVERRFFGNGFKARASHRTPFWSFSASMQREPATSTASLDGLSSGETLGDFLDAILTTRFPDPAQRAALVDSLLASRGLPTELARALELLAGYAQLNTGGSATIAYLSPRTTASLTVFAQSLRLLTTDDALPVAASVRTDDARQGGLELNVSYLLARDSRVSVRGRWLQVRGLGLRDGERTTDRDMRVFWTINLSPRTEASFGPYWRSVTTNSTTSASFREKAVQALLSHRF